MKGYEDIDGDEAPALEMAMNAPRRKPWVAMIASLIGGVAVGVLIGWVLFHNSGGSDDDMESDALNIYDAFAPATAPVAAPMSAPAMAPAPLMAAQAEEELVWGMTAGPLTKSLTPRTTMTTMGNSFTAGLSVESDFDAGNVHVLSATDGGPMELAIIPDPFSVKDNKTFVGRFMYKVTSARGKNLTMQLMNAGDVNIASDDNATRWGTYENLFKARASYDYKTWFLVDSSFSNSTGILTINHTPVSDTVWYAYYPPYPLQRLEEALGRWAMQGDSFVTIETIGESVLGMGIYMAILGQSCEDKVKIWVTGALHPSETQSVYFVEGLADAALDGVAANNETALEFFDSACLYLVPSTNPDGMFLGHHRTNALGVNLNRVWDSATLEDSPEVVYVQEAMLRHSVDLYIDAHADEDHNDHFIFFSEGICAWNSSFAELRDVLDLSLRIANPEYSGMIPQGQDGAYEPEPHCEAALKYSDNWTGDKFGILSGTLEMPFQDIQNHQNPATGFGPERAYEFGRQSFEAFQMTLPSLLEHRGLL